MSIKLIVLADEPGETIMDSDIRHTNLADDTDRIIEDDSIIGWVLNSMELDGAEISEDKDGNQTVGITDVFRKRYFRHYYDEFHKWIQRASGITFEEYMSYHGEMKFSDAERWFKKPNDIYVWYWGWYSTLTEFLRNVENDEQYYVVQGFEIK